MSWPGSTGAFGAVVVGCTIGGTGDPLRSHVRDALALLAAGAVQAVGIVILLLVVPSAFVWLLPAVAAETDDRRLDGSEPWRLRADACLAAPQGATAPRLLLAGQRADNARREPALRTVVVRAQQCSPTGGRNRDD